ncbi:IclR family transcriptional regulator domain-containing protein [Rhodococcus opacus]|uniref:IclR family transcriptional regulator domain-containing protein n=1 Tax=Rhodococcus opacus TaxID=37919 RepID=UPI00031F2CEF|nr:IclR family transcriptional regulator C-terminal domain-containing protein [Rhodococcus opacus]
MKSKGGGRAMDHDGTASVTVNSVERAFAVLRCFDAAHPARTLSEVAVEVGLPRGTTRRFLHTLVQLGYLHLDGRLFSLTPLVLIFGHSYLAVHDLPRIAQPHIDRLAADLGETASVAVMSGEDIIYVACSQSRRVVTAAITVGTKFPAHATSSGRVLIGHLPPAERERYFATAILRQFTARTVVDRRVLRSDVNHVVEQGWSTVADELEMGMRAAAVPVRDPGGTVVAAVNVSLQKSRYTVDDVRYDIAPTLIEAAAAITSDMAAPAV